MQSRHLQSQGAHLAVVLAALVLVGHTNHDGAAQCSPTAGVKARLDGTRVCGRRVFQVPESGLGCSKVQKMMYAVLKDPRRQRFFSLSGDLNSAPERPAAKG